MKFCKYCGRQLADDELCNCPDAQAEAQAAQQVQQSDANAYAAPAPEPIPQSEAPQGGDTQQPQPTDDVQEPVSDSFSDTTVLDNESADIFAQQPQTPPVQNNYNAPVAPPQQYQPQGQPGQMPYGNPQMPYNGQPPFNNQQPYNPQMPPYGNQPYNPQNPQSGANNADFSKFTSFIKSYFVNPNKAANEHCKDKDPLTLIILSVLFVLSCGLCDLGLGINLEVKQGLFFLFGILFGIVGIVIPFVSNLIYTIATKQNVNPVEILSKTIMHTPITTILLLIGFVVSIIPSAFVIVVYYIIIAAAYAVSQASVWIEYAKTQDTSMLKKLYVFGTVFIVACVLLLLSYLQVKAIANSLYSSIMGSLF